MTAIELIEAAIKTLTESEKTEANARALTHLRHAHSTLTAKPLEDWLK